MVTKPRISYMHITIRTRTADEAAEAGKEPGRWRWAVLHFPCLEGVTPRGQLVMVSDRKHIAEVRRKFPDIPLWHEKELSLYAEQTDSEILDEQAFVAVNRLKLKTRGWFMGVQDGGRSVTEDGYASGE